MSESVRIACLQTRPVATFVEAVDEALGHAAVAVERGATFLCLPEYCGGLRSDGGRLVPPASPEAEHPVLLALKGFAREHEVWVLAGSIAIVGGSDRIVNRGFLIDAQGDVAARYDKIHLFDVDLGPGQSYRESAFIEPGEEAVVADLPFARLGMSICYDLRFAHLYRDLAKAGADLLAVPAAFTKVTGQAHWHVLNRARAIETGSFVVAPCAIGPVAGGGESYGHSLIIDPWGAVLADGGEHAGVVSAEIDLAAVRTARARIPSLEHDRPYRSAIPEDGVDELAEAS